MGGHFKGFGAIPKCEEGDNRIFTGPVWRGLGRYGEAYRTVSPAGFAAKGDSMIHALQPSPALKLAAP